MRIHTLAHYPVERDFFIGFPVSLFGDLCVPRMVGGLADVGVFMTGVEKKRISSTQECMDIYDRGNRNRIVALTRMVSIFSSKWIFSPF